MEKRSKGEKKKKEKRGKGQKEKRRKELQEKKGKGEWGKKRKGKKWNRSPLSPSQMAPLLMLFLQKWNTADCDKVLLISKYFGFLIIGR